MQAKGFFLLHVCLRVSGGCWSCCFLLIIDLCVASGKGLSVLRDNTMITSDLQPSVVRVMTVQDFFSPPPHTCLESSTVLFVFIFLI